MALGLQFQQGAPWRKLPVPFLQEAGGGRSRGGGGSCEVCGLGCRAHTRASPDTRGGHVSPPVLFLFPSQLSPNRPLPPSNSSGPRAQAPEEV